MLFRASARMALARAICRAFPVRATCIVAANTPNPSSRSATNCSASDGISHGGGSVPYQIGRWRAHRIREQEANPSLESFDDSLRRLHYDTVLYNQESLDFLFRIVGTDRCMFGTENPGSGSSKDPATGAWMDDLKPVIEGISWLSAEDRDRIFERNARSMFPRFRVPAAV